MVPLYTKALATLGGSAALELRLTIWNLSNSDRVSFPVCSTDEG